MKRKLICLMIVLLVTVLTSCDGTALMAADDGSVVVDTSLGSGEQDSGVSLASAQDETEPAEPARPAGWTDETHNDAADPDYDTVFPQDAVNRIDMVIAPENWQAMLDNMTELYGEFGARPGGMGRMGPGGGGAAPGDMRPPEGMPPQGWDTAPDGMRPQDQEAPFQGQGALRGGMLGGDDSQNPVWVPATVEFEGHTWTQVGLRFKGNSSLQSTWGAGTFKLPFKLDFDEFEDEYPETDDQRFYGFKQLTLASNFHDDALLKEKVVADIFRDAGVPAPHTAFYRVYVDYGEGPTYFGLYTMVEVVDDTVIEEQFEDDGGNVYKPSGQGASFAYGTFDEVSFDKETNQEEADWRDILALFDALHADTRTSDPAAWRENLEAVFDVDGFLRWLAVNTVIQNWDTYGQMAHNYYLYNDPTTGQLTWIPWDNNEALYEGKMRGSASLDLSGVTDAWPLIRYLMDDETYYAMYVAYVQETIDGPFEPAAMTARYQELHDLIQPYVTGEHGESPEYTLLSSPDDFDAALNALVAHVNRRYQEVSAFLDAQ